MKVGLTPHLLGALKTYQAGLTIAPCMGCSWKNFTGWKSFERIQKCLGEGLDCRQIRRKNIFIGKSENQVFGLLSAPKISSVVQMDRITCDDLIRPNALGAAHASVISCAVTDVLASAEGGEGAPK